MPVYLRAHDPQGQCKFHIYLASFFCLIICLQPKPFGTCICKIPYNPDASSIMHFCPRPNCRASYHRKCLVQAGYVEPSSPDRACRILACSPDTDRSFSLYELVPNNKPTRKSANADVCAALISTLPSELVKLAQQPIIKGGRDGGIVGNVKSVVEARQAIYGIIRGDLLLPDNWRELFDMSSIVQSGGRKDPPPLVCPQCNSPI